MLGKRIIAASVAVLILLSVNLRATADDIKDKKNELDNIENRIEQAKEKIDDLEGKISEGENQLKSIESSISKVDGDIKSMQVKIKDVESKIKSMNQELDEAINEYNKQDTLMKSRINSLYKNGTTAGYMEIILGSKSFGDFISRYDILKRVIKYDIDMLKNMKSMRDEIERKKIELQRNKNELVVLKNNMDNKKKELVKQGQDKKNLVFLLNKEKSELEKLLEKEEKAAERVKEEIKALEKKHNGNYDGSKYAILHGSDFPADAQPRITSGYGYRIHPIKGTKKMHTGIDISTRGYTNKPVYSMAPGTVALVKNDPDGYGRYVIIDHGSGMMSLYAHNNSILVSVGQTIAGGQKIALSGSTGASTGPHVHFEVWKNGERVNPAPYYFLGQ